MKKDYAKIKEIKVSCLHETINFDFDNNKDMSLDEYKEIVKKTREYLIQKKVLTTLSQKYGEHLAIAITFTVEKKFYLFRSPYCLPSEDPNVNPNEGFENKYKTWYLQKNDESMGSFQL